MIWLHAAHCPFFFFFFAMTVFMIAGSGANAATEAFFSPSSFDLRDDGPVEQPERRLLTV